MKKYNKEITMKDIKSYVIGFLSCACLFLIMGQTSSKNFGDIEVNSISIKTLDGNETGYFGTSKGGAGMLHIYNDDGKQTASLGTNPDGGLIQIFNNDGQETAGLGTNTNGGILQTFNNHGVLTGYFGTSVSDFGIIKTFNSQGVRTAYFGTSTENDGIILLYDRYGDDGWGMTGKQ